MKADLALEDIVPIQHRGVIDADGHVLEPADLWLRFIDPVYRDRALRIGTDENGLERLELAGRASKMVRRGFPATLGRMGQTELENFVPGPDKTYADNIPFGAMDATERLRLLDAEGLDAVVLYPTIGLLWEAEVEEPDLSQAYCRAYNRWIAEFCKASPDRLIPIAHLSLGDPDAAAVELKRAVTEGCRGAFVAPFNWDHRAFADPAHDPLFHTAVELGVPLAIHPTFEPFELRSKRIENGHRLPMLSAVSAADGVRHAFISAFDFALFDRFPELKLVLLESGGGWIGHVLDRLDGAYEATFIGNRSRLKMRPSEYFQRQCFISCDPDERTIPALTGLFGAERFFWASDYPHADHTADYLNALESMVETMEETDRGRLLGGNVRSAYGIG